MLKIVAPFIKACHEGQSLPQNIFQRKNLQRATNKPEEPSNKEARSVSTQFDKTLTRAGSLAVIVRSLSTQEKAIPSCFVVRSE